MRTKNFKIASTISAAFLLGFIILFPFFGTKAQKVKRENHKEQRGGDTPHHKTIIIKNGDLDKALADINRVNLDSISISVENAMAGINFDSLGKTIEESMKVINTDSLRLQIEQSMKSIDMQKMQVDMQKAMAESQKAMIELQKNDWQKEFQKSMKEMQKSMTEMKLKMPDMKKEMEQARKEMANAKIDMKAELAKAKADLEKSKAELTELKNTVAEMKKDGLIKEGENVKLEWKNGRLFINGKEQSEAVSDKYRKLEKIEFQNDDNEE